MLKRIKLLLLMPRRTYCSFGNSAYCRPLPTSSCVRIVQISNLSRASQRHKEGTIADDARRQAGVVQISKELQGVFLDVTIPQKNAQHANPEPLACGELVALQGSKERRLRCISF